MATFQPKLSPKFYYSGDVEAAKRLQARAVQTLFELDREMRILPAFPRKVDSRTITNSQGMSIRCEINFGISKVFLFVPPGIEEEIEEKFCACCGDCLMVATVLSEVTRNLANESVRRIGVKVCQAGGYKDLPDDGRYLSTSPPGVYGGRFVDNAQDINVGDRLLAFIAPVIKRGAIKRTSGLLRNNIHDSRYYDYQVFDCMVDGVKKDTDLEENQIDTSLHTIKESSCNNAVGGYWGKLVPTTDGGANDTSLLVYVTSFYIAECWESV